METKSKNNLKTKKYVPGSIFVRGNMIWIKYKGAAFSSGFHDSPQGRKQANERLEKLHIDTLKNDGSLPSDKTTATRILVPDAIKEYIEYRERRGFRAATVYKTKMFLLKHLSQTASVAIKTIEDDIKRVVAARYEPKTQNLYVSEILKFAKWCKEVDYISKHEEIKINYYTSVRVSEPEIYSLDEYEAILNVLKKDCPELAAAVQVMWNTGMRKMEALTLRLDQIDMQNCMIHLTNKNDGKPEIIPIPSKIYSVLEVQIKKSIEQKYDNNRIFNIQPYNANYQLNRAIEKASIQKREHLLFHSFRKSYATRLVESEIPITAVQKLMRHKDVNMTLKLYAKVNAEKLIEYANIAMG